MAVKHRKPNFEFKETIQKHWLDNSPFKTHFLNSLTLIFPLGERYFIRSINKVMGQIESELLRSEAKEFIKQEAQHSVEHEKFFHVLEDQGYEFHSLVDLMDTIVLEYLEPFFDKNTNLSITAGLEHITALLSEISLEENFLDGAPDKLKQLFDWHAAEEIEHRSVAFDVLQSITKNYSTRVQGLIIGYTIISIYSGFTTLYLLNQDKELFKFKTINDFSNIFFFKEKLFFKAAKIFLRYLHIDFHPSNSHVDELSDSILKNYDVGVGVA